MVYMQGQISNKRQRPTQKTWEPVMGMTNTGGRPSLAPPSRVEHRLTSNADIVGQLLHTMNNFNAGIMPAIVPLKTLVPIIF